MSINETLKHQQELIKSKSYLDLHDVSILTNFSISTLRKRVLEGRLKAIQSVPRGKLLFSREEVDSFLKSGGI